MKQKWLKVINPLLFLSVLLQLLSGVGMGKLNSSLFHEIHEVNGFIVGVLIAVHVAINFKWFITVLRAR